MTGAGPGSLSYGADDFRQVSCLLQSQVFLFTDAGALCIQYSVSVLVALSSRHHSIGKRGVDLCLHAISRFLGKILA